MLGINDPIYEQTYALKRGAIELSPAMEALRARVSGHLREPVLNVYYDTINIGPAKGRPRVWVVAESNDVVRRLRQPTLQTREDVARIVQGDFSYVVRAMGLSAEFDTRNVLVLLYDFSEEAVRRAVNTFFRDDAGGVVEKFSAGRLWKISGFSRRIVAFYLDERSRIAASQSGLDERVRQACFDGVKRYDEFNYVSRDNFWFSFDTKEHLDKKFEGNLFYYFR